MKKISPSALNALIEALVNIYWYKKDFRNFITNSVKDSSILSRINWDDTKRNIANYLVNSLSKLEDIYQCALIELMQDVVSIKDFSHLLRVEDGDKKIIKARQSVQALEKAMGNHKEIFEKEEKCKEARKQAVANINKKHCTDGKLSELKDKYYKATVSDDPQRKGYLLESIMQELFLLFDLDPKASFKIFGEQIDGAFSFEQTDYIFECKWHAKQISASDLDVFSAKINRKLDNTLGLFLSVNGFTDNGIEIHSRGRPKIILMDGTDLMYVLENRICFTDLLRRKKRHASQTGEIYLRASDILS